MKLYSCIVLLHGDILNQVPRDMVTAAEIRILRGLHAGNNDPCTQIREIGETNRSDATERRRLANHYGQDAFSLDGEVSASGTELVNRYFPPGVPLPQELPPEAMEDEKKYRPDEDEVITLIDPATGEKKVIAAETDAGAVALGIMGSTAVEDDPFAVEREAAQAAPKLEPSTSPLGLRSRRVTGS